MQSIPLAVLKLSRELTRKYIPTKLHAIHTACGIETCDILRSGEGNLIACNPYRLRY